jgi:hypothetical protein
MIQQSEALCKSYMLCTGLNICFEVGMVRKYLLNPGPTH